MPSIPGAAGDSMIRDMWDNADMNALALKSDPQRDLAVLADRIEERAEEYYGECAGHSPDEPRPWSVEGTTVPLSALTCNLLNETIMHGYDMARAAGRKWRIEPARAAMVVRGFFVPVFQTVDPRTFVNAEQAASLQATYQLHLRGGGRLNFVFDDGSLRVEEPSARRVDCHISADPAAFFMMFWGPPEPVERNRQGSAHGLGPQAVAGVEVQVPDTQPLARPRIKPCPTEGSGIQPMLPGSAYRQARHGTEVRRADADALGDGAARLLRFPPRRRDGPDGQPVLAVA